MPVSKFGNSQRNKSAPVRSDRITPAYIFNNFLRRDGGNSVTGTIDMGGNILSNISEPTNDQDVASKAYVDALDLDSKGQIGALDLDKVDKSGDAMAGDLNMRGNSIKNVSEPTKENDASTKRYVDLQYSRSQEIVESLRRDKLDKSGDTMTGDLNMTRNNIKNVNEPLNALDAANKAYVDEQTSLKLSTGGSNEERTMKDRLNMGGFRIKSLSDPVNNTDAVNKRYLESVLPKPVITIYAERKGRINSGVYQWSFGAGPRDGNQNHSHGYCIPVPGRVIAWSISVSSLPISVKVGITKNTTLLNRNIITKASGEYSSYSTNIDPPIRFNAGDVINFISKSDYIVLDTLAMVALLIELDL